jgi:L-iduronidase
MLFATSGCSVQPVSIDISFAVTKPLAHFWRSTGWCPPDGHSDSATAEAYAMQEASWLNHAWISAVPNSGIKYVRVHDLLSLIEIAATAAPSAPIPSTAYDFSRLDAVVELVVSEHALVLGFELMGNPRINGSKTGVFTSFKEPAQIANWYTLVHTIAQRYADKHGLETIQKFRWEPWNEPSHCCKPERKLDENIECDLDSWINYVNATGRVLSRVGCVCGGCVGELTDCR